MTETQLTGKVSKDNIIDACNAAFKSIAVRRENLREEAIQALMDTEKKWDWKIFGKRSLTYAEAEDYYENPPCSMDAMYIKDYFKQIWLTRDEDALRSIYWLARQTKIYDLTLTESQLNLLRPFL
jgi:acyl-CoA reductase-like NAD-dependent aldehyde dehydrogenase